MRKICTRILAAGAAIVLLASCLEVQEPEGISALRKAKAEYITAETQYKLAEIAYLQAETAYQEALTANQLLQNELEALEVELKKLELAKEQAQNEHDILVIEQQILTIQQQMELAIEQHKADLYEKLQATATAEKNYNDAIAALAKAAEDALTQEEQNAISEAIVKINTFKGHLDTAKTNYQTALNSYYEVAYLDSWDYEGYAAKYAKKINALTKETEERAIFIENLKALDVNASIAELQTKVEEYEAQKEANLDKIAAIDKDINANKELIAPLQNTCNEIANQIIDLNSQVTALETENTELKEYKNSEAFFNVTLAVQEKTAHDYATILKSAADTYNGTYDGIKTVTIEGVDSLTVPTGAVKFHFEVYSETENFLKEVVDQLELNADLKKVYEKDVTAKVKAFEDAKAANDKKVELNNSKIFDIDSKVAALNRQKTDISKQISVLEDKNDELVLDKGVITTANTNLQQIISIYTGLIAGTVIEVPDVDIINAPDNTYSVEFKDLTLGTTTPEELEKAIEAWIEYAELELAKVENELETRKAVYEELLASEDITTAMQLDIEYAELELALAEQMYNYYLAQFEYWTNLLNELTVKTE